MLALFCDNGDTLEARTFVRNGREFVGWLSDWSRWTEVDRLRPIYAGPGTYGHVDLEVIPWEEWYLNAG